MRRARRFFALLPFFALPAVAVAAGAPSRTRVTAGRLEYDYDAPSILLEDQVKVEDPRFEMTADRAVVFLRGDNDVSQVVASGQVVVVSSNRTARCNEAVYTKDTSSIVMLAEKKGVPTKQAYLKRIVNGKDDVLYADKITIWLDSQRIDCEPARIILDGGMPRRAAPAQRAAPATPAAAR